MDFHSTGRNTGLTLGSSVMYGAEANLCTDKDLLKNKIFNSHTQLV